AAGVPGADLVGLAGNRPVATSPGPNRAVLYDRHSLAQPRTVIPFAPLDGAATPTSHPDVPPQQEGAPR
ncbi:MAG TPA: hypothetical protein VKP11_03995, partial [Frankiaceae bacterium]|nr:hypothetical protein [Frankiaceae bacterium]